MSTNFPNGIRSRGVEVLGGGGGGSRVITGNVWFVDSGAANGGDSAAHGKSPDKAFLTLDYAIGRTTASNGDVIYVLPGHAETIAAVIAVDVAGLSIVGVGEGYARPQITGNFVGDTMRISAANCVVENLVFNESTAAATANIDVTAADNKIIGCRFDLGATDLDNITVGASADRLQILGNIFEVSANGPDSAITVEGAADSMVIQGNHFNGGSSTNTWDDAAIDYAANVPLNCLILDNDFLYATATLGTGNILKASQGNRYHRGARPKAGVSMDWYADPSGSTTGSGTAEDPTTLNDAVDLASAGDRVLVYPGVHTITVALAMDVAGMVLQPVYYSPGLRSTLVEIANDTDDVNTIDVTAARCAIQGFLFTKGVNNTTDGTELIDVNSGGDYLVVRDCVFDMEARTNADCVNFATGTKGHLVENCLFTDLATVKSAISSAASTEVIRNCIFDGSAADFRCYDQLASPGAGGAFYKNLILGDAAAGAAAQNMVALQGTPGKIIVTDNYVFDSAADVDSFGDAAAFDPLILHNFRDGAADGTRTALNPSST